MNSNERIDDGETDPGEASPTLDAALIYEDLSTGVRGKYVFESAARLFPMAPRFDMAMWRFDVLRRSSVREMALKLASVAVMVLLSAHGRSELPKAVKIWVKRWLERKGDQPCALLVSLDGGSRGSASAGELISWLEAGAKAKDVAVFSRFGMTPSSAGEAKVEAFRGRVPPNRVALDGIQRRPDLHSTWGINE